jgi:hypothetical protein
MEIAMVKSLEERIRDWEEAEKAQREKPKYYAGLIRLFRFSDYEYKYKTERKIRTLTIVPTKDARIEYYKPFDFEPGMLRDYLEVKNALRAARKGEDQVVVDHMKSFLDGVLPSSEGDKQNEIERLKRYPKSSRGEEKKRAEEYVKERIAFVERLPILTPELESKFQARLNRDKPLILDFCRTYGDVREWTACEGILRDIHADEMKPPVPKSERMGFEEWLREESGWYPGSVNDWYDMGLIVERHDAWERIRTSSDSSDPVDKYIELLNGFTISAGVRLVLVNGHWRMDFEVEYLMDALGIMLINTILSGKDQIRICALDDCRRPFITRDPRANYCCQAHSQRGRVRKHRKMQNGKEPEK